VVYCSTANTRESPHRPHNPYSLPAVQPRKRFSLHCTSRLGENGVRVGAYHADCADDDHEDHGKYHGVLCNILTLIVPKSDKGAHDEPPAGRGFGGRRLVTPASAPILRLG
jgi:hypothetical protein